MMGLAIGLIKECDEISEVVVFVVVVVVVVVFFFFFLLLRHDGDVDTSISSAVMI